MAWNEPGGGNDNKDPWNSGGNDKGPPDLDEAFKKLQDKLNGMFGSGGSKSGGTATGPDISGGLIALIFVVIAIVWAAMGIYQVDEKDRAVVLRLGKFSQIYGPGLHWNPPLIDTRTIVNVTEERQYPSRGLMLSLIHISEPTRPY